MSQHWFYLDAIPSKGAVGNLSERETKHARGSRRLEVGTSMTLFDGKGTIASATISNIDRSSLQFRVDDIEEAQPILSRVHLASALPKGDRQATMISMAAQLGITSFTPLWCERSVTKVGRNSADRWLRIAVEACKQSRNAFLPSFESARQPVEFAATMLQRDWALLVAHPCESQLARVAGQLKVRDLAIMIGPEGGFSDAEIGQLTEAGAQTVGLGSTILRIETACVSAITLARHPLAG